MNAAIESYLNKIEKHQIQLSSLQVELDQHIRQAINLILLERADVGEYVPLPQHLHLSIHNECVDGSNPSASCVFDDRQDKKHEFCLFCLSQET
jgi:hypothetical protein